VDLVFDGFRPVWDCCSGGFGGIGSGTERVRTHVADGDSLAGCSGDGYRGASLYFARTDTTRKPAANLLGSV